MSILVADIKFYKVDDDGNEVLTKDGKHIQLYELKRDDRFKPLESEREKEARYLKEMDPRELFLYNKERGFTYDQPITSGDMENLQYEKPGVFFAGGGIAKIAGDSSGRPPVSGPNPQGLLSLKNRVRNY